MNEPSTLLQSLHVVGSGAGRAIINELSQFCKIVQSPIPILHQNLTCKLSPKYRQIVLKQLKILLQFGSAVFSWNSEILSAVPGRK